MPEELVIANRIINGVLVSMQVSPETRDKWEEEGLLAGETVIAEPEPEADKKSTHGKKAADEAAETVIAEPEPEADKKSTRGKKAADEAAETGK